MCNPAPVAEYRSQSPHLGTANLGLVRDLGQIERLDRFRQTGHAAEYID